MVLLSFPLLAFCGDSDTSRRPTAPTVTWVCNPFRVPENEMAVGFMGGAFTIPLETHPSCPWSVNSFGASVLRRSHFFRYNDRVRTFTFTVAENTGGARSALITIRGPNHTLKPIFVHTLLRVNQAVSLKTDLTRR